MSRAQVNHYLTIIHTLFIDCFLSYSKQQPRRFLFGQSHTKYIRYVHDVHTSGCPRVDVVIERGAIWEHRFECNVNDVAI